MKNSFTTKQNEGKEKGLSFLSARRKHTSLTNGFYKFLLGFTVIIALSFGTLLFLGSRDVAINPEPALTGETK